MLRSCSTVATTPRVLQLLTCTSTTAGTELPPAGAGDLQGLSLFNDDVLRLLAEDPSGPANGQSQVHGSLPLLPKGTGLRLPSRAHDSGTSQPRQQQLLQQQQQSTPGELLPRQGSDGDLLLLLAQWQQQQQQSSAELLSSKPVCKLQQQQHHHHHQLAEALGGASTVQHMMQRPQHLSPQQHSQLLHPLDKPVRQASTSSTATTITAASTADARAASSGGDARSASGLVSAGGGTGALFSEATAALNRLNEAHFGCTPNQLPQRLRVMLIDQLLYGPQQ